MHKIKKFEAREFVEKQNYDIILSTKLCDYSIDDNDYDTVYFPISKKQFLEQIQEEEIVWTKEREIVGFWDDWEEILDNIISGSYETEEEFYLFCVQRDINWKDWVEESNLSTRSTSKLQGVKSNNEVGDNVRFG